MPGIDARGNDKAGGGVLGTRVRRMTRQGGGVPAGSEDDFARSAQGRRHRILSPYIASLFAKAGIESRRRVRRLPQSQRMAAR